MNIRFGAGGAVPPGLDILTELPRDVLAWRARQRGFLLQISSMYLLGAIGGLQLFG